MTEPTDDADELTTEELDEKVREHVQRRKDAYVKMGTVGSNSN